MSTLKTLEAVALFIVIIVLLLLLYNGTIFGKKEGMVTGGKRTVTLHYTNWCGYCKQFKPVWAELKASMQSDPNVEFKEVDGDVSRPNDVESFPTILLVDSAGKKFKYSNIRTVDKLRDWIYNPY